MDKVIGEVYEWLPDSEYCRQSIDAMEIGAGYTIEEVNTRYGMVQVYVYKRKVHKEVPWRLEGIQGVKGTYLGHKEDHNGTDEGS
jgi:gamma-glutamylcyclotransferase (GGCT)/AIG2-like uncharacterized protein YtfP